ncbi:YfhO family protein [Paenibacillus maysiensis]|uniref:YfhO family protein n=1 Tax=Paenibacillus maysiensis TaxID=1155954 RepID=UPI000470B7A7|nr:YfhO family protein [Paenibacillus maysiensis]
MEKLKENESKAIYIIFIILGAVCIFLYWNFLSFSKLYVYTDSGADTINSYWPMLSNLMYTLKQGELPFWSFNMGMGMDMYTSNIFIGDPLNYLLLFINVDNFAYGFGYLAIIKILISAVIFYKLILRFNISFFSSIIGTILFGLNGYMILWGQHYQFASVMIYFPLLILSFERLLVNNYKKMFIFSVFLIAIFSYYFLFIMSIFLLIYATLRYLTLSNKTWKGYFVLAFKTILYYLIGIMLGGFILIPTIKYVLLSPRVNGGTLPSIFDSLTYYLSAYFRLFSNNTLGIGSEFLGVIFYYDAPILYSSIACLLLVPQFLSLYPKKYSVPVIILYGIIIIFLVFPFFSAMLNAFSKVYYRWTFVIVFFNIFFSVFAFDKIIEKGRLNIKLLYSSFIVLLLLGLLAYNFSINIMKWNLSGTPNYFIIISLLFLLVYTILLSFVNKTQKLAYIKFSFAILLIAELLINSYSTINNRPTVGSNSIQNNQGYFDWTKRVIENIKVNDNSFYRIKKAYSSVHLNDALIQQYNGFNSYNSLNSPSYINFLQKMDINLGMGTLLINGLNNRLYLENLFSQKYYLTKDDNTTIPFGYRFKKRIHDIQVYENEYWLPLGITYDNFVTTEEFMKLNNFQRDLVMLRGAVIEPNNVLSKNMVHLDRRNIQQTQTTEKKLQTALKGSSNLKVYENKFPKLLNIEATNTDPNIIMSLKQSHSGFFRIKFDVSSNQSTEGQIFWSKTTQFNEASSKKFNLKPGDKTYAIDLGFIPNISNIRLDISNSPGNYTIKSFSVYKKDIDPNYTDYINVLKKDSMKVETLTNNRIIGNINLNKNKLLFLSIPYDEGWNIKIDGTASQLFKVNLGFIGIEVPAGSHKIEMSYVPPGLYTGVIISCFGLMILIGLVSFSFIKRFRVQTS